MGENVKKRVLHPDMPNCMQKVVIDFFEDLWPELEEELSFQLR